MSYLKSILAIGSSAQIQQLEPMVYTESFILPKILGLVQFLFLFISVLLFFPSLITYISFKATSKKGEKPADENKVARNCLIASIILFILFVLMGVVKFFVEM